MGKLFSICKGLAVVVFFYLMSGTLLFGANWNPLPDTGQTKCYDVAGNEITCPAEGQSLHGQDAQYHGQTASYTSQTVNGDDIVIDNNINLVWQKNTADTNNDGVVS